MKILVTGANGYLGQGIVKKLIEREHEVVATDLKTDFIDQRAHVLEGDLFAIENPFEYFGKPDVLLHLAWRNGFVHYSDSHIVDLPRHYNFIKDMSISGIKKLAVMGSVHEIGFYEGCVNENTPCNPVTPYGVSKNALRELTKILADQNNIMYQWLRGYYIVGNSKSGSSIFSKIVAAVDKGEKEFPFTMGQNQFDFLDYDEFIKCAVATIEQNDIDGIINICSGNPEKLAIRVEQFIRDNNYEIVLKYGAFPDRKYDSKAIWGDTKKINNIIKKRYSG